MLDPNQYDLTTLPNDELLALLKDITAMSEKPMPYVAHAKQEIIHRSTKNVVLAIAGNRGGKSRAGARETTWRALGTHPYKKVKIPQKIWVGSYDFPNGVAKIVAPKVLDFLENRQINKIHKNNQSIIDRIELINGSTIDFKSYEQDYMKWEGEDIDFAWFDEPPPQMHYEAASRGLVDRNGDSLITATPLKEPWVHETLWEPGISGDDPDIECVNWSSYDNPYIDHEAMRRFESRLTPEMVKVRIHGEFRELVGRCLPSFKDREPIIIPYYRWPRSWPYFECLDPHQSKPHAFIRAGVNPDKRRLVVFFEREIPGNSKVLGNMILTTRPEETEPIVTMADTSIAIRDQEMDSSMQDRLEAMGISIQTAYKKDQLLPGLDLMDIMFNLTMQGFEGGIEIMDTCKGLVKEAKYLRWDDKKEDTPKGKDDLLDCLRYICNINPLELDDKTEILHNFNPQSYTAPKMKSKNDSRKYSNNAFDLDEDEDDGEQGVRFNVRRYY